LSISLAATAGDAAVVDALLSDAASGVIVFPGDEDDSGERLLKWNGDAAPSSAVFTAAVSGL
jgi:hypothetical protein